MKPQNPQTEISDMRPQYTRSDVENLTGEVDVSDLHNAFYQDAQKLQDLKDEIPELLRVQDYDEYERRLHYATYHAHMQKQMSRWLATVGDGTLPAEDVLAKYQKLKHDFLQDHRFNISEW